MLDLVGSPRFIDAVIAAVLAEAAGLVAYRRRTGRGVPVAEVASFLGAGLALLLAMRALAPAGGGGGAPFAAAMAAGLACHVWHLAQRWDV